MSRKQTILSVCIAAGLAACAPMTQPPAPANTRPPASPAPPPTPTSSAPVAASSDLIYAQFANYTITTRLTDQGGGVYEYKYAGKADCSPDGDSGTNEAASVKVDATNNQPASILFTFTIPKGNCYAGGGIGFFANESQDVIDLTTYSRVRVYLASPRGKLEVFIGKCAAAVNTTATLSAYTLNLASFKGEGCDLARERAAFDKFQVQDSFIGPEGVTNTTIQVGEVSFIK
jgi:hypothetical protein